MSDQLNSENLLALTAQIVVAQVGHNEVVAADLPALITSVYRTIAGLGQAQTVATQSDPAVPIKKSVFKDHIVCLDCGRKLKMLKRHLLTDHKMTPALYREKWGLPLSYPLVAPDYAARRSALAKTIGLGRKGRMAEPAQASETPSAKASGKRGRKLVPAE